MEKPVPLPLMNCYDSPTTSCYINPPSLLNPNSYASNASVLGSTLAAALAQLPAGAQQQQLEQDLLNHLAGNYNLMLDPSSTDSNNLAVQFIKLAREAHDASTSAQFFEHGCQRTVSIQTQPHNDYPPFYAFKIGTKQHEYHQQQQQFMIVDQDTHVAYFNFADLPSSKFAMTVEESKPEGTLRLVIQNFSKMTDTVRGPSKIVQNVPWRIMIMPRQHIVQKKGTQKCLGFFLQCCPDAYSDSWSCSAAAELRLISQKQGITTFSRKTNHNYTSKENDWGYSCFMTWADILDEQQGYIHDDTVILEVHVKADPAQNVMSLEEFRKKVNGYIRLASLQCERGLIDKAIDCNAVAMKLCKDRDPECVRKLTAQSDELVKKKLAQSIARIERGSDAVAEPDQAANITALRIAMTGGPGGNKANTNRNKRKPTKDDKRGRDETQENNPPNENSNENSNDGSVDENKKEDKDEEEDFDDEEDDDVCDVPDHPSKCLCAVEKLETLADHDVDDIVHTHGHELPECDGLAEFDGQGTFESFEELVSLDSSALEDLLLRLERSEAESEFDDGEKFSLPRRFELLARSLICDGGYTFADIIQKESQKLLETIIEQTERAVQICPGDKWSSAIADLCSFSEDEHLQNLQSEPLFELKSQMEKLQQRILKNKREQRELEDLVCTDAEAQTDFPPLSAIKEQHEVNTFNMLQRQAYIHENLYNLAQKQLQQQAQVEPRRTLTPRTKKSKHLNDATSAGGSSASTTTSEDTGKKENRKRKERANVDDDQQQGSMGTSMEAVDPALLQAHAASIDQIPPQNMEQMQQLLKSVFSQVVPQQGDLAMQQHNLNQEYLNASREGLARYTSQTMDILTRAGTLFASSLVHLQETSKNVMEQHQFTELPKYLEAINKFAIDNKLIHGSLQFPVNDSPLPTVYDCNSIYQFANDPEGDRKANDFIDQHIAHLTKALKHAPQLISLAKEITQVALKFQIKAAESHKEVETLKNERKQLTKERNQMQKAEKTSSERLESLKQENNNLKQQIKSLEKKASSLQSDRDDELQRLRQQLEQSRQEITEKDAQHGRDIQSLSDVKRNYGKELGERQTQIQRLKDQLEEKSNLLKKAETDRKQQKDTHNKTVERAKQAEMQLVELKTEHALKQIDRTKTDAEHQTKLISDRLSAGGLTSDEKARLERDVEAWNKVKAECTKVMEEARAEVLKHVDMIKEGKLASQLPRINIPKPPQTPNITPLPPIRSPSDLIHPQQQQQLQQKFLAQQVPHQNQMSPPMPPPHPHGPHGPAPPQSFRPIPGIQQNGPPPFANQVPPQFNNNGASLHNQHMAPYMNQQRPQNMMFQANGKGGPMPPQQPIGSRLPAMMSENMYNKYDAFENFSDASRTFQNNRGCNTPAELEQLEKFKGVKQLWDKDDNSHNANMNMNNASLSVTSTDPSAMAANVVNSATKYFPSNFEFPANSTAKSNPGQDNLTDNIIRPSPWGDSIWSFEPPNNH